MGKHIVIHGCMRSATQWLTFMFRRNLPRTGYHVEHEGFKKKPLSEIFELWSGDKTYISIGYDGAIVEPLYERFPDLQVALLARDPFEQIMSAVNATTFRHVRSDIDTGLLMNVANQWGPIDLTLNTAAELGIDVKMWHFDYYTTLEGFIELAQSLGLELRQHPNLREPMNARRRRIFEDDHFPPETAERVRQLQSRYKLAGPAYAAAKAYADEKLGRTK